VTPTGPSQAEPHPGVGLPLLPLPVLPLPVPLPLSLSLTLSLAQVWDAIPEIGKWQIVLFVGLMDIWRESKVVGLGSF